MFARGVLVAVLLCGGPPAITAQESRAGQAGDGQRVGINVHGHWTIVVRDEAGKEVSRREFENALVDDGKALLAALLTRQAALREWGIQLVDAGGVPCGILLEPTNPQSILGGSKTVAVRAIAGAGGPAVAVELTGDTRAITACDIARVETAVYTASGIAVFFTRATLASPIAVAANRAVPTDILHFPARVVVAWTAAGRIVLDG